MPTEAFPRDALPYTLVIDAGRIYELEHGAPVERATNTKLPVVLSVPVADLPSSPD